MDQVSRNNRRKLRALCERICGDGRYGIDPGGVRYSKDIGADLARNKGLSFVGPDGSVFVCGDGFGSVLPLLSDWHE